MTGSEPPTIAILGGGFGGAYCAQALERLGLPEKADIFLLDRNNYFIFYPLLVEAGTGSLEPRHAVVSIRSFLRRTTFRMAEATHVDLSGREIQYRVQGSPRVETRRYDHLVIALGSVTNLPPIPGLQEHGFQLKSLSDAVGLRDRAIQLLEQADGTEKPEEKRALLHFVVVGANFTGVEAAGEFDVFLKQASRFYRNVESTDCRITLVEIADRILPALDHDLASYAMERLQRRGVHVRLQSTVAGIRKESIRLSNGEELRTRTVVWCAGIAPHPLIRSIDLPVDTRGYILCDNDLRVRGHSNVWAIGDCAVNPDRNGKAYPATAQHAVGQARWAAKNISAVLAGREPAACDLTSLGSLAALGCRTGVAKVLGFKMSGLPAWMLWRTVYLLKMPGWSRRIRIALDWTMDFLFRRDYVQLGVHRTPHNRTTTAEEAPELKA